MTTDADEKIPTEGKIPTEEKANINLKFEYDGGSFQINCLSTTDTVGDLREVFCSALGVEDFDELTIKTLQPTKVIDLSDESKPLSEVFHQTRERIVVSRSVKHHKPDPNCSKDPLPSSVATSQADHKAIKSSSIAADQSGSIATTSSRVGESIRPKVVLPHNDLPVCSSTGYLLRHPVPSNNSCLFISVHFCLTHGIVDDQIGKSMRKIIADTVASDKQHFDEAFLGKPNADYCKWILDDNNWGGAIELSILCKYYETEIVAIDVKNTILNRFGEDSHYPQRMLLLYDGLHYDPLKFQPLDDNQPIQTLFSSENLEVLTLAEELAKEAKQSHQFTDMKTISMRCASCNAELNAQTAALHAAKTGHAEFLEK